MNLNLQHIPCINTNAFLFKKNNVVHKFQATPVGGVTNINNFAKTQRQSLMG